ncbi:hypothetical protein ACFVH6_15330 [Spirillospora sp. NPDC127200]
MVVPVAKDRVVSHVKPAFAGAEELRCELAGKNTWSAVVLLEELGL